MTGRQKIWKYVGLGTLWAVALCGALNSEPVFAAVFGQGHSICGRWGCAAPLPTLLQWHVSVAVVLLPLAWQSPSWSWLTVRHRSWILMLFVASAVSLYVLVDAVIWALRNLDSHLPYIMNRAWYSTISQTDIPCLPILAASILTWLRCRRAGVNVETASATPLESQVPTDETIPSVDAV